MVISNNDTETNQQLHC